MADASAGKVLRDAVVACCPVVIRPHAWGAWVTPRPVRVDYKWRLTRMADVLLLGRTQICQVDSDRKLGGIHASLLTTAQRNACSALGIFHFAHWAGEAGGVEEEI